MKTQTYKISEIKKLIDKSNDHLLEDSSAHVFYSNCSAQVCYVGNYVTMLAFMKLIRCTLIIFFCNARDRICYNRDPFSKKVTNGTMWVCLGRYWRSLDQRKIAIRKYKALHPPIIQIYIERE